MDKWTKIAELAEALTKSVALLMAGLWTYLLFVRRRLGFPRIQLDLSVTDVLLPSGRRLVHAEVLLFNSGTVVAASYVAELRLRQVLPLRTKTQDLAKEGLDPVMTGETEIEWPMIVGRQWDWEKGHFEIEPGENDSLHADFVIDDTLEKIQFYFFMANAKKRKRGIGWTLTQFHTLDTKEKEVMAKKVDGNEGTFKMTPLQQRQQKPQKQQQQQQPKAQAPETTKK